MKHIWNIALLGSVILFIVRYSTDKPTGWSIFFVIVFAFIASLDLEEKEEDE